MKYRVAINGYGRIGQGVLRGLYQNGRRADFELAAINELAGIDTLAYLTRYDTTHGRFPFQVRQDGDFLFIGDDAIRILCEKEPEKLPWQNLGVDLLFECSGSFHDRLTAEKHIRAGAGKVLISHPASEDVDATIVYGYNHQLLNSGQTIVSNASCTTNCIIPVLHELDQAFGIDHGLITTVHSAMNDQPVIDSYHNTNLRLTRSAMQSIIPVDTSLGRGIGRIMPHLAGCFECLHLRVPTINVSMMDLSVRLGKKTTAAEVNALFEAAASQKPGLIALTLEPHASVDFNQDLHSCIVDGTQTRVSGGQLVKMICWFDNEWAFANRMLDVGLYWLGAASE
ncbi:MAG: erythrose-4-phosphate dehydrogenase [Deltaproteobacteria bacterium]|nr:MAG: erythrose-4-phosphate dehydrogenase [Deltaproteobacteria bacterium]